MTASAPPAKGDPRPGNFLRAIVERDLEAGTYAGRRYAGSPGDAAHHAAAPPDPARIRTRFPPEPNGYLHIGHAKSICLNFGLARDYGGVCHLRFDDTNPEKEEQEYVDAIVEAVHWLGFDWTATYPATGERVSHLYYASSYFESMYRAAEHLVEGGHAYVDEQSAEQMRAARGDFNTPGTPSPWRDRDPAANLARLREMRAGLHADGAMVLRARIDMASPNINLRDPTLYRIKRATHHATGDAWCIYPMYTFAHPIEDALEGITHSICTLEFEDQRPFYDWLLERLAEPVTRADGSVLAPLVAPPLPRQHEFARLNVTHVVTSKRRLRALVEGGVVEGWDDPRMPTIAGLRRRGYTPQSLQLFAERTGVSKAGGWVDQAALDGALREDLDARAPRAMAVLDPLKLVIENWDEAMGSRRDRRLHRAGAARRRRRGVAAAALRHGPRGLDRARRLRRAAAQGLPPPLPGQPGAAEVRPRRRVHRLREGRRRQRGRGAGRARARHQERHARRRPRSRSRASSPGSARTTAPPPRCASTSRCSSTSSPTPAGATSWPASIRPAAASCRRWSSPRSPTPGPRTASSSSATATSSPTAATTRRAGRCSTASPG